MTLGFGRQLRAPGDGRQLTRPGDVRKQLFGASLTGAPIRVASVLSNRSRGSRSDARDWFFGAELSKSSNSQEDVRKNLCGASLTRGAYRGSLCRIQYQVFA